MEKVRLVAMIDRKRRHDLDKISKNLTDAGLEIDQTLDTVGIVSGNAAPEVAERIKQIDGITHVRQEGIFKLPGLDEDTPQ